MSANALMACYANPMRVVDGATFDGTNDWMTRGAGLTGAADSKSGIISAWLRIDTSVTARIFANSIAGAAAYSFRLNQAGANGALRIEGLNAAAATILTIQTNSTFTASATWLHILAAWDLATAAASLYINDVADMAGSPVLTNDTIDYTVADWSVGGSVPGVTLVNGCEAELYFAPGQYLDFSRAANRRKFISASGKPVHLGTDGSLPTGVAPLVYLHLDDAEAVANFATNRGTGGNFSITGTLATASTSPSD